MTEEVRRSVLAFFVLNLVPEVGIEPTRGVNPTDRSFDRTLERAIVALLDTPAVDASARLKPKGIGYAYTDERLESLTAAQKQLLRMGPRNVRMVSPPIAVNRAASAESYGHATC